MREQFTELGLKVFQFDSLLEFKRLVHGVFSRHGVKNLGLSIEDDPEEVQKNRFKISQFLGISCFNWVRQVHGNEVLILENVNEDTYKTPRDGIITNLKQVGLGIKHADCQATIIYDPFNHALANIHCGWRGNVQEVYLKAIESMKHIYGSRPENLIVGISPSLGPNNSQFINHVDELPESFRAFKTQDNYFNLWEIARWQLEMAGVLPHHIEIASICTYENHQDWFSYRRDKIKGLNNATVAALL